MTTSTREIPTLGLTSSEFIDRAAARRCPRGEALEIYHDLLRRGSTSAAWASPAVAPVVRTVREGAVTKIIQRMPDGLETESVIIPGRSRAGRARTTLCVSSQVGCALGCAFCETARMGLRRHLTAEEIVGQWYAARVMQHATVTNIVFMGMGEPLENLPAVAQAIRVLADDHGPAIAPARITVSTAGRAAGIRALAQLKSEPGFGQLRLAVSINAATDALRSRLMPVNRATPLAALMDAMLEWTARGARTRVLIEYVLIPGVNDSADDARTLGAYLQPLPSMVNVIPYNPIRDSPWPAPGERDVDRFVERLAAAGQPVRRRRTRGRSVMAACGQLGNPAVRRRPPGARAAPSGAPYRTSAAKDRELPT